MAWSDERVELISKLWAEGLSASQIAARLPGVSRNAVISKLHRLGLLGHGSAPRYGRRKRAPNGNAPTVRRSRRVVGVRPARKFGSAGECAEPPLCREPELVIPGAERRTLVDLELQHCRWPIGDPRAPSFHFCARTQVPGLPYCEFHVRRAFVAPRLPAVADAVREVEVVPA